jgi:hypothetical protein
VDDTVDHGDGYRDWRSRIRLGQDATSTLDGTYHSAILHHGDCNVELETIHGFEPWKQYSGELTKAYLGFNDPGPSISTIADDKARSKFLADYIRLKNTWRGGNFLAEVGETVKMLRHPVRALFHSTVQFAKSVKKFRKRPHGPNSARAARALRKALSDAWLTWAFGIQPLIADCNDAAKAVNVVTSRHGGTGHDTTIISGSGRDTVIPFDFTRTGMNFVAGDPGNGAWFRLVQKSDYNVKYRACVRAALETPRSVAENFGVDPYDALPAVWEAIPWSFFIDYFVNVQEMVDSIRLANADISWCYVGVRNAGTYNCIPHGYPSVAGQRGSLSGGGFYTLVKHVHRAPTGIPYPRFHLKVPGIGSKAWLNIAALTSQIL